MLQHRRPGCTGWHAHKAASSLLDIFEITEKMLRKMLEKEFDMDMSSKKDLIRAEVGLRKTTCCINKCSVCTEPT